MSKLHYENTINYNFEEEYFSDVCNSPRAATVLRNIIIDKSTLATLKKRSISALKAFNTFNKDENSFWNGVNEIKFQPFYASVIEVSSDAIVDNFLGLVGDIPGVVSIESDSEMSLAKVKYDSEFDVSFLQRDDLPSDSNNTYSIAAANIKKLPKESGSPVGWNLEWLSTKKQLKIKPNESFSFYHYFNFTGKTTNAYLIDDGFRLPSKTFHVKPQLIKSYVPPKFDDDRIEGSVISSIIASEAYGVAKSMKIHSIQVTSDKLRNIVAVSTILFAIDDILQTAVLPGVIHFAFHRFISPTMRISPLLDYLLCTATTMGLVVVLPSGDSCENCCNLFSCPNIIKVGSLGPQGQRSTFSNYGCTDFYAPGEFIYSAMNKSFANGSVLASAHVVGIIGILLEQWPFISDSNIVKSALKRFSKQVNVQNSVHEKWKSFAISSLIAVSPCSNEECAFTEGLLRKGTLEKRETIFEWKSTKDGIFQAWFFSASVYLQTVIHGRQISNAREALCLLILEKSDNGYSSSMDIYNKKHRISCSPSYPQHLQLEVVANGEYKLEIFNRNMGKINIVNDFKYFLWTQQPRHCSKETTCDGSVNCNNHGDCGTNSGSSSGNNLKSENKNYPKIYDESYELNIIAYILSSVMIAIMFISFISCYFSSPIIKQSMKEKECNEEEEKEETNSEPITTNAAVSSLLGRGLPEKWSDRLELRKRFHQQSQQEETQQENCDKSKNSSLLSFPLPFSLDKANLAGAVIDACNPVTDITLVENNNINGSLSSTINLLQPSNNLYHQMNNPFGYCDLVTVPMNCCCNEDDFDLLNPHRKRQKE